MRFDIEMNNKEHWPLESTNPQADTSKKESAIVELVAPRQLYGLAGGGKL